MKKPLSVRLVPDRKPDDLDAEEARFLRLTRHLHTGQGQPLVSKLIAIEREKVARAKP